MTTFSLTEKTILDTKKEGIAVFVQQDELETTAVKDIAKKYFPALFSYCKHQEFSGQAGKMVMVPVGDEKTIKTLFIVGLGKKEKSKTIDIEVFRRAVGSLIKNMQRLKVNSCGLSVPTSMLFGVSKEYLIEQLVIIANMAAYHFDEYITDKSRRVNQNLAFELCTKADDKKDFQEGISRGIIIATAVNRARHWIDLPPVALTPTELALKAQAIAKEFDLDITVFGEQEIKKMGMGGLAGVSAGSEQDCKFVIMEYNVKAKDAPTLAFVGKGITFDSGGLSLKPPRYMETMKEDMSGAAAVIATMQVIAQLKPKVNVIGLTPLSENLPSDKATKPGDIIKFYNGLTAEVKNTDAEGRLILADALAYAVKHYKPDAMVDIATLTGACAYALGPFFTGLMGEDEDLLQKIKKASIPAGDPVWALPFTNDYKTAVKSNVADICNIGNEKIMAGAITAGFFLQHFVDQTPWAHLDIAGTAFNVPDISYYGGGATGVGVRLLVELAMNWPKNLTNK